MTSTTEPLLQIPLIHWQLTQLECPTFLMSGGWQPQPGSRYPGSHVVLYTCHQHPSEGIQLPVNKMHVSMCTTICVYQYKQPYSQALTCKSEQKRQVHSVCASICQFSMVLMYLCIKLSTLATFLQVTFLSCMDTLKVWQTLQSLAFQHSDMYMETCGKYGSQTHFFCLGHLVNFKAKFIHMLYTSVWNDESQSSLHHVTMILEPKWRRKLTICSLGNK